MRFERLAPAKVNLFLHVGAVGEDGYHPLSSLVTFADIGDVVSFSNGPANTLTIDGPFAEGLSTADNLVARARDAFIATFDTPRDTYPVWLDKRLPIAAGLGGGSSDAAATLMLMAETLLLSGARNDEEFWDALYEIARQLGADTWVCIGGEAKLALGRGDELDNPPVFPDLDVVLVNPGVPSSTGRVYAAYDEMGAPGGEDTPEFPEPMDSPEAVADFLARCRNDLEAPALRLQPVIGETLTVLKAQPETLLARMSGSGSTCFALCRDRRDAADLALRLGSAHGHWWVQACRLKGFWT
jgi:4-diphosphocytidyl-2-C-methyl-D-erythritol kinase